MSPSSLSILKKQKQETTWKYHEVFLTLWPWPNTHVLISRLLTCRRILIQIINALRMCTHTTTLRAILIAIRELLETRFESFVYLCSQLTFEPNIKSNIPYFLFVKMTTIIYWTSKVLKLLKKKKNKINLRSLLVSPSQNLFGPTEHIKVSPFTYNLMIGSKVICPSWISDSFRI